MAWIRQSSFHAGEIAPHVAARSDLASRQFALRRARNFIIGPTGRLMNRPGLQLITEVKDSAHKVRLLPFTFSTSQSYLLEVGHQYLRVLQGGGYVLNGSLQTVELVTPWTEADLPRLQFAQVGNILTIVHPNYIPRQLQRGTSNWDWTLSTFSVTRAATQPTGLAATAGYKYATDDTHLAKKWSWCVSVLQGGEESLPSTVLTINPVVVATDSTVTLTCNTVTGADKYLWYRGRDGVFGYIGCTTAPTFTDEGVVPNYSDAPATQKDPFNENGTPEYPSVVTYHQQRTVFGSLRDYPQRIVASQTGNLKNFDTSMPAKSTDPLDFTLASRQYEEIRGLVSLKHLLAFTANAEYAVDSGGTAAMTPTTVGFQASSENGSSWLRPLVVNNQALYVQARQGAVRNMSYDYKVDGWAGQDLSQAAPHLLSDAGRTIVDWCYARNPFSIVWAVRDDGVLLSLTLSDEMNTKAWAWHDTDGVVECICSVPEGVEDAVYVITKRANNKRYIERMATRRIVDARWAEFLDASIYYDGAPATVFTGLAHLNGQAVYAWADGVKRGPFIVSGGQVTLPLAASTVAIGLPYFSDIELLDLDSPQQELHPLRKTVVRVMLEVDGAVACQAGETFSNLTPWTPDLGDASPPAGGLRAQQFFVPINGSWNPGGRAVLRVVDPCPVTVVAASRDVEIGG